MPSMRSDDRVVRPDESDDEVYNEAEDDDFNPEQQDAEADPSSSEDEGGQDNAPSKKRKIAFTDDLDSGDEATIRERKTKKRRKDEEGHSEDEGGLIKTRSQRQAEYATCDYRQRTLTR